jgi:hypothetical protein
MVMERRKYPVNCLEMGLQRMTGAPKTEKPVRPQASCTDFSRIDQTDEFFGLVLYVTPSLQA